MNGRKIFLSLTFDYLIFQHKYKYTCGQGLHISLKGQKKATVFEKAIQNKWYSQECCNINLVEN